MSTDTGRFGFKMLEKMGWAPGKGLGKEESGMTSHIKAVKRSEGLGLGCDPNSGGNGSWYQTSNSFAEVLNALNAEYGQPTTGSLS